MEAETDTLGFLQAQKLFLWGRYDIQIYLEAWSLPWGLAFSSRFEWPDLEESRVPQIVKPADFQLPQMMLLELVDLEGRVHVVYCEQILPDFARVED